ncbi:hypothetical protein [Paralcaligenes ureilyticus]|uniref:hypothetical protein n=1 Tax=Paralcaligenes ureilyticus TaxID=627131 RepID=UPI001FB6F1F1|nr:hypothetical protein [Paralcaligenes ureilyticus]
MKLVGQGLGLLLSALLTLLSRQPLQFALNVVELIDVFHRLPGHRAPARFIQIEESAARMLLMSSSA